MVLYQQADICQLGMDQRKVNVLAREYCDDIKRKNKPIILSHRMLLIPLFKNCMMLLFGFLNEVLFDPAFHDCRHATWFTARARKDV